jgi:hypothetical protein
VREIYGRQGQPHRDRESRNEREKKGMEKIEQVVVGSGIGGKGRYRREVGRKRERQRKREMERGVGEGS